MAVFVSNQQNFPVYGNGPSSTNINAGLSSILIGILPVLVAGLLSPPSCPATPVCPVTTPCPLTTACPAPTPSPLTTPCPMTSPCPPAPLCEPIPVCPEPFIELSTRGGPVTNRCFFFSEDTASFRDAIVQCAKLGGHLLNVHTLSEGIAVAAYIGANYPPGVFWFGYTDFVANDDVVSLSGGPIPIPFFGPLPADNKQNQDCLALHADTARSIQYNDCLETHNYVCDLNLATQKCVCPP